MNRLALQGTRILAKPGSSGKIFMETQAFSINSVRVSILQRTRSTNATDSDGDGVSDLNEYLEGTNPLLPGDRLRITAFSTNSGGTSSPITWTSTTSRLYTIETSPNLSPLSWVNDATFSYPIAPDAGTSTTRTVTASSATKRFYKVKSIRPLAP